MKQVCYWFLSYLRDWRQCFVIDVIVTVSDNLFVQYIIIAIIIAIYNYFLEHLKKFIFQKPEVFI